MNIAKLLADARKYAPFRAGVGAWIDKDQNKIDRIVKEVTWFTSVLPNSEKLSHPQWTGNGTTLPTDSTHFHIMWFEYVPAQNGFILGNNLTIQFYGTGVVKITIESNFGKNKLELTNAVNAPLDKRLTDWLSNKAQ